MKINEQVSTKNKNNNKKKQPAMLVDTEIAKINKTQPQSLPSASINTTTNGLLYATLATH